MPNILDCGLMMFCRLFCEQGEYGWRLCRTGSVWWLQDVWPRKGIVSFTAPVRLLAAPPWGGGINGLGRMSGLVPTRPTEPSMLYFFIMLADCRCRLIDCHIVSCLYPDICHHCLSLIHQSRHCCNIICKLRWIWKKIKISVPLGYSVSPCIIL